MGGVLCGVVHGCVPCAFTHTLHHLCHEGKGNVLKSEDIPERLPELAKMLVNTDLVIDELSIDAFRVEFPNGNSIFCHFRTNSRLYLQALSLEFMQLRFYPARPERGLMLFMLIGLNLKNITGGNFLPDP